MKIPIGMAIAANMLAIVASNFTAKDLDSNFRWGVATAAY